MRKVRSLDKTKTWQAERSPEFTRLLIWAVTAARSERKKWSAWEGKTLNSNCSILTATKYSLTSFDLDNVESDFDRKREKRSAGLLPDGTYDGCSRILNYVIRWKMCWTSNTAITDVMWHRFQNLSNRPHFLNIVVCFSQVSIPEIPERYIIWLTICITPAQRERSISGNWENPVL